MNQPLRSHLDIEGGFGHFDDSLLCILRVAPSATVYWHVRYNFNEVQVQVYIMQFEPANIQTI